MKRALLVAVSLVACSKAAPTPAPPVASVAVAAASSFPATSASAAPSARLGPPVVLDGKAYDADTGTPWTESTGAPWPTPRSRENVGEEVTLGDAGNCRIVVGKARIACLDNKSQPRWTLPPMKHVFEGGADMLPLAGGDVVVYGWGQISDSGAELVRVHLDDGKVIFRVELAAAGVGHSKYRHEVFVRTRGDGLDVVSIGSYAKWVEVVTAATGKSRSRWAPREK